MDLEEKLASLANKDKNLYNHLKQLFQEMLVNPQQDLYDAFENISLNIKHPHDSNRHHLREHYNEIKEYIDNYRALILKQNDGEEAEVSGAVGYIPNLIEEAKLFQYAGIGISEDEAYLIMKSLTKLAQIKQTKQLRLWGKILCSIKDYYIAEGTYDGAEDGELAANVEPRGTGVNKYAYFATNNLLGEWVELPLATPETIQISKKIKYLFKGDLNAKVVTNPHFPGQEKELLRAQIARISFSCTIIPQGIYKVNEEDVKEIELIEQDENFKPPIFQSLLHLDNWQHFTNNILKEGRVIHMKPENIPEDQDEETVLKKIEAADPFESRLKSLSRDVSLEGISKAWIIEQKGDKCTYTNLNNTQQKNLGLIVIKSLIWKGFVHLYQESYPKDGFIPCSYNQRFQQSMYVGYGFKSDLQLFYPKVPQNLQDDPVDLKEEFEPRENQAEKIEEQVQEEEA